MDMPYVIMFFPSIVMPAVDQLAPACDMKLVHAVPVLLGNGPPAQFPISGPSVFRLENMPGSKVYAGALSVEGGPQGYQDRMQGLFVDEKQKTKEFLESVLKKDYPDVT